MALISLAQWIDRFGDEDLEDATVGPVVVSVQECPAGVSAVGSLFAYGRPASRAACVGPSRQPRRPSTLPVARTAPKHSGAW